MRERLRKGIFFIPTLLTMGNILCGFFAVVASLNQHWHQAGIAIAVAFLLDGLDGRIARLIDNESDFGLQLDSLADMVSFGVAPAVLAYTNWLFYYERLGILLAFVYVCGAALRLARFNAHDVKEGSLEYFNGFPTPAAAGVLVSLYFIEYEFFIATGTFSDTVHLVFQFVIPFMVLVLSYLMLSNIRYPTFKNVTWFQEHPFGLMFALLFFVFITALFPLIVFSALFLGYFLLGLFDLRRLIEDVLSEEEPEKVGS